MWDGIRNKYIEARGEPLSTEVKVYKLSPEELEKYRKGSKETKEVKLMDNDQKELTREKYIELKQAGLTDTQIAKQFDLHPPELTSLKHQWGLSGYRVNREKRNPEEEQDVTDKSIPSEETKLEALERQIADLKKELEEKEQDLLQREAEISRLIDQNAELFNELGTYKKKYDVLRTALKELL